MNKINELLKRPKKIVRCDALGTHIDGNGVTVTFKRFGMFTMQDEYQILINHKDYTNFVNMNLQYYQKVPITFVNNTPLQITFKKTCVVLEILNTDTDTLYHLSSVSHQNWQGQICKDYDELALLLQYLQKMSNKELVNENQPNNENG